MSALGLILLVCIVMVLFLSVVGYSLMLQRRAVSAQGRGMSSIDQSVAMARESFEMQRQGFEMQKRSMEMAEEALALHRKANQLLEDLVGRAGPNQAAGLGS